MQSRIEYSRWTFPADRIKAGNLYLVASLTNSGLEANTLNVTVECDDKSILDFVRNTPLHYYPKSEKAIIFYIQDIQRVAPRLYSLSATSAIGRLITGKHYGGVYTGQTVAEVIPDICRDVPCTVKTMLGAIKLYGWLPIAPPRDNFAQVLFAIGAAVKGDLEGALRVEGLWDGISGGVPSSRMYTDASVGYGARVSKVLLTEHQYTPGLEEKTLFEGTAQQGDIITFDEPMHSLSATGFSILESGANYAKLSTGSGALTGKAYIHNTRELSRAINPGAAENVKTIKDATLVGLLNSNVVADRLANYYKWRETIQAPIVYDGEKPGDRLSMYHPFDRTLVTACLESADINLSNTLKAETKSIVGYAPIQMESTSYTDERVLLTSNGSFTVPPGVTRLTVVMISGGQGGASGCNGKPGKQGGTHSVNEPAWGNQPAMYGLYIGWGWGGEGGAAGNGGQGGRVVQVSMDVTPGQVIPYTIGTGGSGGSGGADTSRTGANGGDTSFGPHNTSKGSPIAVGFLDPVTGQYYGRPGNKGYAGGRGSGTALPEDNRYNQSGIQRFSAPSGGLSGPQSTQLEEVGGHGVWYGGAGYSPGGGAAYGVSGPSSTARGRAYTTGYGDTLHVYATAPAGAPGASPGAGSSGSSPGAGGNGGHGGGGGGGEGRATAYNDSGYTCNHASSQAAGGRGSNGGRGANGCVIVYYSVPKPVRGGMLRDKQGRTMLDKLGRKIIV